MKFTVLLILLFPTLISANDVSKNIFDEFHVEVNGLNVSFSDSESSGDFTSYGAGIAISIYNQISDSVKIFTGVSLSGGKRKDDDFESTNKEIGLFLGRRDIFNNKYIDVFASYEVQFSYSHNSIDYFVPNVTVFQPNSKIITFSTSLGKTINLSKKQAIEGKLGASLNYNKYDDGSLTSIRSPIGSLSWVYLLH